MPESLSILFSGAATLAIIVLALSFVITALRKKKVNCPQCGAKTPVAAAYYTDETTGQQVQGEPDIPFALVSASARTFIGVIAITYVFAMLFSALGYESCELQGISMVCNGTGTQEAAMQVNLLYSLLGIVGGVIVLFNGITQFMRARNSTGKNLTNEYICKRNHAWTD